MQIKTFFSENNDSLGKVELFFIFIFFYENKKVKKNEEKKLIGKHYVAKMLLFKNITIQNLFLLILLGV